MKILFIDFMDIKFNNSINNIKLYKYNNIINPNLNNKNNI